MSRKSNTVTEENPSKPFEANEGLVVVERINKQMHVTTQLGTEVPRFQDETQVGSGAVEHMY